MTVPYKFTPCRTIGHAWTMTAFEQDRMDRITMILQCDRCHMQRRDMADVSSGELDKRRYWQPKGYRSPGLNRSEWRHQFITRLLASKPKGARK